MLEDFALAGEHVFTMDVQAAAAVDLGPRGGHVRRMVPIVGGRVSGPRLQARILPGADWQQVSADGLTLLEAHHPLETEDGVRIEFHNRGVRSAPLAIARQLQAGEVVDPRAYYFRTAATFGAPAGTYEWLNHGLFVGVGARTAEGVSIRFFLIA